SRINRERGEAESSTFLGFGRVLAKGVRTATTSCRSVGRGQRGCAPAPYRWVAGRRLFTHTQRHRIRGTRTGTGQPAWCTPRSRSFRGDASDCFGRDETTEARKLSYYRPD